ncbi:DUF1800 family protein [Haloferula sp.]|uniref:DUF1800 family protein n=1 Tax=Haloferula sp. TaxID=2497595 RepID=UPI00329B8364
MSRSLLILIGAAVFCDSPRTFAAAQSNIVWQLGLDDSSRSPFSGESGGSNTDPGSATSRDDDYYFAGSYPAPIGVLAASESDANVERALTVSDPRNRVHFPLTAAEASSDSRLTVTVDLMSGGAWTGVSQPGFGAHDVTVRFNGQVVVTRAGFTDETTLVATFPASSVNAVTENNIIEIERTGGRDGGYIQFDFIRLESDPDALADFDNDDMPLWFEQTYGLDDGDPADALLDPDNDFLNSLGEFLAGTNPTNPDTDNDGLDDGAETSTDPLNPDSDDDSLLDGDETTSNPLLSDTDSDGFFDNVEVEQGTDPDSPSSTPFPFAGVVGLHFVSERSESTPLPDHEPAGLFRFPHWNASSPQPHWYVNDSPLTGSLSDLKNCLGQATTISASWSYRYAVAGFHKGTSDERVLNGMLAGDDDNSGGKVPVTLNLTGIPYSSYDLIAYVGDQYPEARATVELSGSTSSRRYFIADTAPPFRQLKEITADAEIDIDYANYVRFRNLSGASQTVIVSQLTGDRISLHGIQIIDTGTNTDSDSTPDAIELEYGLNPAVSDDTADLDDDGLNNSAEILAGTDPSNPDTDGDGLLDGNEAAHNADPLDPDSDDDTLSDGDEVNGSPFASLADDEDSDNDGFDDSAERRYGSDPNDNTSTPPPVPDYHIFQRTWTWTVDNVRVRWNHAQTSFGTMSGSSDDLFEVVTELDDGGWSNRLVMGLRYNNGNLVHRFYANTGVFHREENSGWSLSSTGSTDLKQALGFSGHGENDVSHPLRFEFTAYRPQNFVNSWTVTFTLYDVRDPGNPVTVATSSWENAVSVHAGLTNGSSPWTDTSGNPDQVSFELFPGITANISRQTLKPADGDLDGMPDDWENLHTLNPADPADALLDPDNDTVINIDEFLAGTDPRDDDSDDDGVKDGIELGLGTSPISDSSYPAWVDFNGNADDLDGNGLSDAWTLWSGGTPRVALADDDGDGMSNREESEAGTDPDDPESRLEMKLQPSGSSLILEWSDLPNKSHMVEASDGLNGWGELTGVPPATASRGMRKVFLINELSQPNGSRFFRTSVNPMDSDDDGVEDWIEENILGSSSSEANSMGQALERSDSSMLSGDARALLDRMRSGDDPAAGSPASNRPSRVHASRFLMQSTFGPTLDEIDRVRDIGFDAWLDEQFALPPSYFTPYIKQIQQDAASGRFDLTYDYNESETGVITIGDLNFTTPFARNAIGAEDQLRQRVAFALSQILVISRRDDRLGNKPEAMAQYYDMLIRHAFGKYDELLLEVSLNPSMGWYLSSVGNEKADTTIPRFPDENYAREIMQLFTIGLWELNSDGSRKLDTFGEPISTYTNDDITELARVFTGLYYDAPYGWGGGGWEESHFLKPMVMHPERHDFDSKTLLNGLVVPAREPTAENGLQDVRDAVLSLTRNPNAAPFISRKLIQFLVTDNPSPAYLSRVSSVFASTDGDLGQTVRAILTDSEARSAPIDDNFGKLREPVIRTMHLGRLFEVMTAHSDFVWWNSASNYYDYSFQEPLYSPSVFNFFTAEYQAPGDVRDRGLVSPGFQIMDTYSSISFPNRLWDYLRYGFISSWNGPRYPLDFSDTLLVADDLDALIDRIDLLICTGNMTPRTRETLKTHLSDPDLTSEDRVAVAVWTVMNSPEGAIQR